VLLQRSATCWRP